MQSPIGHTAADGNMMDASDTESELDYIEQTHPVSDTAQPGHAGNTGQAVSAAGRSKKRAKTEEAETVEELDEETARLVEKDRLNKARCRNADAQATEAVSAYMAEEAETRADFVKAEVEKRSAVVDRDERIMKQVTALFDILDMNQRDRLPGIQPDK